MFIRRFLWVVVLLLAATFLQGCALLNIPLMAAQAAWKLFQILPKPPPGVF